MSIYRKLMALLMTVIMLAGMMPIASAELVGPVGPINCNHNWDWRYPNGEPKHCQDERLMEMYCTLCGQVASSYTVTGDHMHGSWQWDYTPPANCYEWGIQNEFCSVCGEVFNEREVQGEHQWGGYTTIEPAGCETPGLESKLCTVCGEHGDSREIPALGHDWGDWRWEFEATCKQEGLRVRYCKRCNMREEDYVTGSHQYGDWKVDTEPTCTERGLKYKRCTICGDTQWLYIDPVDHSMGEWRVVEEPQVGLPGYERRFCIYQCGTYEEREIPPLEEAISLPGLELTLELTSVPANGEYFVVGEEVVFTETWANNTDQTLYPFSVHIFTCAAPVYGSEVDQICSWYAEDYGGPVAPGATNSHTLTVTVTEADVARGAIYAQAELLSTVQDGPDMENVATPYVTAPCGKDSLSADGLSLSLSLSSTPANGTHFVVGETVVFTAAWANTTPYTLKDQIVSIGGTVAPVLGSELLYLSTLSPEPDVEIAPGASGSHSLTVVVSEADVANGAIHATADFSANTKEGVELGQVTTPFVTAPCGKPADDAADGLSVTWTYTNTPANGEYFTPGEVINFVATVTNNGSETLTNFFVGPTARELVIPTVTEIAPGQTIVGYYYHQVWEDDAKAGHFTSGAFAQGWKGDPKDPSNCVTGQSEDVTAPCGMGKEGSPAVYYKKMVANYPANGVFFTEGETIVYRLVFINNSKKAITSVTLNDPLANVRSVAYERKLEAGESLMADFSYVVTAADVAAGQVVNTATSTWEAKANGTLTTTPSNTVITPCGSNVPPVENIDALLEKYVMNAPANGEYFVPGETIEYAVIFMNVCPHELHDVEVFDPLKGSNEDAVITREPVVEREGTLYLSFNYVVTEEDAERGYVENTASAFWLNPEIEEWSSCESNTVITETGYGESTDLGLTVTKSVTSTPANGAYYVPGEEIHFLITVNNDTGKALDVVVLTDPLSASFYHEIEAVPAGESVSRSLVYTVTEFDAEIGNVTNYAYAVAYVGGKPHSMTSNSVTVPCGFHDTDSDGEPDEPYGIHTWLDVTKEVESLPMNGLFYVEGETVAYKITYTNAGESVLIDVRIYDALVGMAEIATAEYMEPGDSRVCYLNYTVTEEDTKRGYVTNTAIGQYVMHGYVNTFYSNEVTVQTNYFKNVTFVPGASEDPENPEMPVIPDGPGTIDPGKLPLGESSCVRTITGKDNASASYEISFCADHVAAQSTVLMMKQTATTPEMKMQTAAYAVAMWRTEAAKLYQQLLDAADNQGKITVMTEYVRFLTDVANYEAMLKVLHPDQPAVVAQKIADIWEDKCVTLCYEIHTAAAQRKDSLLSVTAATGAAADCTCTVTAETAGTKAYTQGFCATHAFPFGMIDMMLQDKNTAEGWAMVRQIWTVELTSAYNMIYAAMGDNKLLAMAEYYALTQWMMAREAYLNALYPDNPELVAQIMVKHIMDRVNDLCPALK